MKKQRGVTLVELTTVLVLLGIIIYIGVSAGSQIVDVVKRQEFQLQETVWKGVLDNIQEKYMTGLANDNGTITSPGGVNLNLTNADVGACGTAANIAAVESLLENFAGGAEAEGLEINPYGGRWCLRVGDNDNKVDIFGLEVVVRPLGVLSAGRNGVFDTADTGDAIADLACPDSAGGDSDHICSSGVAAAAAAVKNTQEKMAIIAEKLQAYSRAQAILNPHGGFVDYFLRTAVTEVKNCAVGAVIHANPAYDINSTGPFGSTADDGNSDIKGRVKISDIIGDADFPNFQETLGITAGDAKDGFGGDIYLDNSSCSARHPYHPEGNNRTPPFSIRIVSVLPGGNELVRIIFSDF